MDDVSDNHASTPPTGPDSLRSIELTKIGDARFKATNARGGETFMGTGGEDPDFTPVELLLAAIAGCSAIDVDLITRKRAGSTTFELTSEGHKVRDEQGNHLTGLRLSFDVQFPEGPEGDAAREFAPAGDREVARPAVLGEPHRPAGHRRHLRAALIRPPRSRLPWWPWT